MGLTGAGKSAFISRLTEQDIAIGHTLRSCKLLKVHLPSRETHSITRHDESQRVSVPSSKR